MLRLHVKSNGLLRKLDLDFVGDQSLTGSMTEDEEVRSNVVRKLFYLITATAEDGAAIAAQGQSARMPASERRDAARKLRSAGEIIEIVASAIEVI